MKKKLRFAGFTFCWLCLAFVLGTIAYSIHFSAFAEPRQLEAAAAIAAERVIENYADERFEVVSLVFRLAERPEYAVTSRNFQIMLNRHFDDFRGHPAVAYTADYLIPNYNIGFAAPFALAMHLVQTPDGFVLRDNLDHLLQRTPWTQETATKFVEFLNDFYIDTNFADFFIEQTNYFNQHNTRFYEGTYQHVNFDFFAPYLNLDNVRIVISPSNQWIRTVARVQSDTPGEDYIYIALPAIPGRTNFMTLHLWVINQYIALIAPPIAERLYAESEDFRMWADTSAQLRNERRFGARIESSQTVAQYYVTRAFVLSYLREAMGSDLLDQVEREIERDLIYIEEVIMLIWGD